MSLIPFYIYCVMPVLEKEIAALRAMRWSDSRACSLTHSLTHQSLINSLFTQLPTQSLTHLLICSITNVLIYSLARSLIYLSNHSFTHSLIQSLTHLVIHIFTPFPLSLSQSIFVLNSTSKKKTDVKDRVKINPQHNNCWRIYYLYTYNLLYILNLT